MIICPKILMLSAIKMMTGTQSTMAMMRGSTKKLNGSKPIVFIASISSVSFIAPICAVKLEADLPATTIAAINGATSLSVSMPMISTINILAPKLASIALPR